MNIVITGANGFLGSNLCNLLSEKNNILALSRKNDKLKVMKNLSFLQCDLHNISEFKYDIIQFKPKILIHCAWIGSNNYLDLNSLVQFENVKYSFELLKLFNECGIDKFIGLGTGAEYGFHDEKVTEESILNPNSLYGSSKNYFKKLSENFCLNNSIDFAWVLPMYVYGYNDVQSRFIPNVINKCLNNETLILNSCSSNTDYLFVEDFAKGIECIIDYRLTGTYNISSGFTYKSKEIVELISILTNYKKEIIYDSSRDRLNFQNFFCGSSEKLQKKTNWKPTVSLEDGLIKTITSMR